MKISRMDGKSRMQLLLHPVTPRVLPRTYFKVALSLALRSKLRVLQRNAVFWLREHLVAIPRI